MATYVDSTPSRLSLAALCTPNGSPLPDQNNAHKEGDKGETVVDATPASAEQRAASSDDSADKDTFMGEEVAIKGPDDTATVEAEEDMASGGAEPKGEGDDEEDEDEDEDGEEDEEEDEEDEEDDEEEGESGSESGTFQSISELEGVEGGAQSSPAKAAGTSNGTISSETAHASSSDLHGSAANSEMVEGAASTGGIVKNQALKKKRIIRRRSPSVDMVLPLAPPPRPTIRMKLTIARSDEEQYLTNVPEEVFKMLKEENDPWADWYSSTLPEQEDTEMDAGPSNGGPDLSELGGLAKLLQKYPDTANGSGGGGGGGGRKKKKFDEYDIGQYDVRDPFVDDSELGVDEPTHSAKPSADGFFVTQGEVELEEAKAAAKDMRLNLLQSYQTASGKRAPIPIGFGQSIDGGGGAGAISLRLGLKPENDVIVNELLAEKAVELGLISPAPEGDESRQSYFESRNKTPTSGPSLERRNMNPSDGQVVGSQNSPIKVDDNDEDHHQQPKAPSHIPSTKYPTRAVPRRLEREFDNLRQKVSKESWLKKTKFPPSLREPLMQASKIAVALNEYNDNFFNWLPHIFPYNRLTLHKYTKRQFLSNHTDFMKQLQDINMSVLESQIKETLPILRQEYEEQMSKWTSTGGQTSQALSNGVAAAEEETQLPDDNIEADVDAEEADKIEEEAANRGIPVKRWRWSEPMREVFFTIITIDNAMLDLRTEKMCVQENKVTVPSRFNFKLTSLIFFSFFSSSSSSIRELEGSDEKASISNARKAIYKRIIELWPEKGWATTTNLSREYALYKRKVDRYTIQYHETQGRDITTAIQI